MAWPSRRLVAALSIGVLGIGCCSGESDDDGDDDDGAVYSAKPSSPTDIPDPDAGNVPAIVHQHLLLIDDFHVESRSGLSRVPGRARKENGGLPVLLATEEWEHPIRLGFYTSVVYDEANQLFQMWYMAQADGHRDARERESPFSAVGYAESTDGVHWTRPPVGLPQSVLPVIDGPPQPTGVTTNVLGVGWHGFNVLLDPTIAVGHPERYKAAYDNELIGDSEAWLAYSADGISWTPYVDGPVIGRAADTANQIQWDSIRDTYLMVTREDLAGDVEEGEVRGSRIEERSSPLDIAEAPTDWRPRSILALDEGFDACDAASNLDTLRYEPTWHGISSLSALAGQTIRIAVELRSARVYAIELVSP